MKLRRLRKVERLESWVRPRAGPEPRDQVVSAALRRLATDDLLLLIGALDGRDPGKALSAELLVSAGEGCKAPWKPNACRRALNRWRSSTGSTRLPRPEPAFGISARHPGITGTDVNENSHQDGSPGLRTDSASGSCGRSCGFWRGARSYRYQGLTPAPPMSVPSN